MRLPAAIAAPLYALYVALGAVSTQLDISQNAHLAITAVLLFLAGVTQHQPSTIVAPTPSAAPAATATSEPPYTSAPPLQVAPPPAPAPPPVAPPLV